MKKPTMDFKGNYLQGLSESLEGFKHCLSSHNMSANFHDVSVGNTQENRAKKEQNQNGEYSRAIRTPIPRESGQ